MTNKKECCCLFCSHPVVKRLIEFYCLVWGIIGLIFLIGCIWGFVRFETLGGNSFFRGLRKLKWEERVIGPAKGMELGARMKNLTAEQKQCLEEIFDPKRLSQLEQTPGLAIPEERENILTCLELETF